MERDGLCRSLWQDTTTIKTSKPELPAQDKFDVIIAGAGVTGLATALLLQKSGKSVLVAEAKNIGFGTTGGTTAHLNTFMDTPYHTMQKKFGDENTRLVAQAIRQSLSLIKNNIEEHSIDCNYTELPGFLFSQDADQTKELEHILEACQDNDVPCFFTTLVPTTITYEKALQFDGQASFHPLRYITGLAEAFKKAGGVLLEGCRVTAVDEGETIHVKTELGEFLSSHFIYATHIPPGVNLLHFRCAPYRSYAIAVELENEIDYPDGLVYDMYDPYHYYRTQEIDGKLFFIVGGEDHKTGHEENTQSCLRNLEAHVRKHYAVKNIVNAWSSQYFEPVDGLPYIGPLPGHSASMWVATGYGGNGMVYSHVAAELLTGLIVMGESAYKKVFDPNRIKPVAGFSNFVKEAADVVGIMARSLMPAGKLDALVDLAPGEAKVVKFEDQKMAVYKTPEGEVFALHAACTHIKCEVAWNGAEKTWDCPCHGSRFSFKGEMLNAPARKDLTPVHLPSLQKSS